MIIICMQFHLSFILTDALFHYNLLMSNCFRCQDEPIQTFVHYRRLKQMSKVLAAVSATCNSTFPDDYVKKTHGLSVCDMYKLEPTLERNAFPSPWLESQPYDNKDITLVTQMTAEKIPIFVQLLDHWTGPVSVTYYMDCNDDFSIEQLATHLYQWAERGNIFVHIVLKIGVSIHLSIKLSYVNIIVTILYFVSIMYTWKYIYHRADHL